MVTDITMIQYAFRKKVLKKIHVALISTLSLITIIRIVSISFINCITTI